MVGGVSATRLREIAASFPGPWQCGAPSVFGREYLDWVAARDGITLRIQAAEKLEPTPGHPLIATF